MKISIDELKEIEILSIRIDDNKKIVIKYSKDDQILDISTNTELSEIKQEETKTSNENQNEETNTTQPLENIIQERIKKLCCEKNYNLLTEDESHKTAMENGNVKETLLNVLGNTLYSTPTITSVQEEENPLQEKIKTAITNVVLHPIKTDELKTVENPSGETKIIDGKKVLIETNKDKIQKKVTQTMLNDFISDEEKRIQESIEKYEQTETQRKKSKPCPSPTYYIKPLENNTNSN